jgi:hypothetical protein
MKELKHNGHLPIPIKTPPTREHRGTKRWVIAQNRGTRPLQAKQNSNTENAYHRIIAAIKQHYLKPGDTYFERDYKQDKTENLFEMHCFMCNSVLLRLDCMLYYDYEVEFAFYDCPFEAAIRAMLKPLCDRVKEIELKPNFTLYYEHVLRYHKPEFIHTS